MIDISVENNKLVLEYTQGFGAPNWVLRELEESGTVTIGKVFDFTANDVIHDEIKQNPPDEFPDTESADDTIKFDLAEREDEYFVIKSRILRTKFDVFLACDNLQIDQKTFTAARGISVFKKIDNLVKEPIVIGGAKESSIPISEFELLLKNFPTTTELTHYTGARISVILREYLGTMTDAQENLDKYLKKKKPFAQAIYHVPEIFEFEIAKYEYIRDEIIEMLEKEKGYSELQWQELMLKFILLIFPKYIAVLSNVHIKDYYSKPDKSTNRFIDISLADANGNLDIIEIKKPDKMAISRRKYRDNYAPTAELSGGIMQAEKYLFHLNKWGIDGEKSINAKHGEKLPDGLKIKITNPKAILILGRSNNLNAEQKFDFEIIKRKYANILDIITYDDLLFRLENIISKYKGLSKTETDA